MYEKYRATYMLFEALIRSKSTKNPLYKESM